MIVHARKVKNGFLIPFSEGLQGIIEKVIQVDVKIKKRKAVKKKNEITTTKKKSADLKTYKELRDEAILEHFLEKEKRQKKPRKVTQKELDWIRKNFGLEDIKSFDDVIKKCK